MVLMNYYLKNIINNMGNKEEFIYWNDEWNTNLNNK